MKKDNKAELLPWEEDSEFDYERIKKCPEALEDILAKYKASGLELDGFEKQLEERIRLAKEWLYSIN